MILRADMQKKGGTSDPNNNMQSLIKISTKKNTEFPWMLTYQEQWNPKYLRDSNSCAAEKLTWNPNKA